MIPLLIRLRNISETARIPIIIALNKVDKFVRGGALKGDSLDRIRRERESGTKSTDIRESSSIVVDSAFDDGGGEMNDDDDDNDYEDEDDDDDAAAGRRTYSYERLNVNTPGARRVYPATVAAAVAHWRELIPGAVAIVPISAQHGTNVNTELLDQLVRHAPPGPPFFPDDAITDRPERFFVSEIIRECIMEEYRAEIPYSCEVLVTAFKRPLVGSEVVGSEGDSREKERRRDSSAVTKSNQDGSATAISTAGTAPPLGPVTSAHIEAAIYVTRKSQKGILIGKVLLWRVIVIIYCNLIFRMITTIVIIYLYPKLRFLLFSFIFMLLSVMFCVSRDRREPKYRSWFSQPGVK